MEPLPKSDRPGLKVLLAGLALLLSGAPAYAREAESEVAAPVPCALMTEVAGEVDLLDASRTHLLDSSTHAAVPCGGWVSVGKGSAELKHRDGFRIHLGAGTFVQIPESNTDGKNTGDHAVLFRGQVFAQAGGGNGELRVITANSRARIRRGSAVVVYNHEDEETQLIALDSTSSLENRFEPSRRVTANPGEATSLNFKQLRVVPSTPRAVALAALRPKFDDLRVPDRDRKSALHSAQSRQERIFATALVDDDEAERADKEHAKSGPQREVASDNPGTEIRERLKRSLASKPISENYSSHADDATTRADHEKWANRLVAGQEGAAEMLAPKISRAPIAAGEVRSASPVHRKARKLTPEDEEKLKLIDELSRIHEE